MTKLRQRMIEDLRIRNYAAKTIDSYIRYAAEFAKYFGESPDQLGIEHIRDYQVFLVETKKASWAVFNQTVCALRFFYRVTFGRSEVIEHIPFPKQEKKLPVILSTEDLTRFFSAVTNLKHRFVQTGTENERAVSQFLQSLVDRGLDTSSGLLVVVDGSKGLLSAIRKVYRKRALIQRCQWHKRENVVSYLPEGEQPYWRRKFQHAYERPTYDEAKRELLKIRAELQEINESAVRSLDGGFEETLTLHRLGLYAVLGRSLKTTNILESVNSQAEERCCRVDHWQNSSQKQRWLAAALLDIEPRLRKLVGYRHLPKLQAAIAKELKLESGGAQARRAA